MGPQDLRSTLQGQISDMVCSLRGQWLERVYNSCAGKPRDFFSLDELAKLHAFMISTLCEQARADSALLSSPLVRAAVFGTGVFRFG